MLKEILMSLMVLFNSSISNSLVNTNSSSFNNNLSNDTVNAKVDTNINNNDSVFGYTTAENYFNYGVYDYKNKICTLQIYASRTTCTSIYRGINSSNYTLILSPSVYLSSAYTFTDDLSSYDFTVDTIIDYYFVFTYVSTGTSRTGYSTHYKVAVNHNPTFYNNNLYNTTSYNSSSYWSYKFYHDCFYNYNIGYKRIYLNGNLYSSSYILNNNSRFNVNVFDNVNYYYFYSSYFTFSNLYENINYSFYYEIYYCPTYSTSNMELIFTSSTYDFTVGYKSYIEEFATFDTDLENKTCILDSFLLYANTNSLNIEYYLNDLLKATKQLTGTSETTIVGSDTFTYTFNDTGYTFTDLDLYKSYDCYVKIYSGDTLIQTSNIETFEMGSVLYFEEFGSLLTDLENKTCELESFLLYSNIQNLTLDYYLNNNKVGSKSLIGIEETTNINNIGTYSYSFNDTGYIFKSLNLDSSYDCYIKFYNTDTQEYLKMTNIESFILTTNTDTMKIYNVYLSDIYSNSARLNYSFYSVYTPIVIYFYLNNELFNSINFQNVANQKYNKYFDIKDLNSNTKYNYKLVISSTLSSSNIVSKIFEGSFNTSSNAVYGDVIDLPGLMFNILAMPFAFYSQAFNLTLFSGTPYAINIGDVIMFIISLVILITIIKIIISMKG